MSVDEYKLRPWQQVVVDQINKHEELADSERMQILSEVERNKLTSIQVSFPVNSGHSSLASWIATNMQHVALIYFDTSDYVFAEREAEDYGWLPDGKKLDDSVVCVSVFQIYHDLSTAGRSVASAIAIDKTKDKINGCNIVVVDGATRLFEMHPEVIEWLYLVCNGVLVFLG